jgi:hypothetical protein
MWYRIFFGLVFSDCLLRIFYVSVSDFCNCEKISVRTVKMTFSLGYANKFFGEFCKTRIFVVCISKIQSNVSEQRCDRLLRRN